MVGETIVIQPPVRWLPSPEMDFRHGGFADIVWADGHAKPIKRETFLRELPPDQRLYDWRYLGDRLMAPQKD